MEKQKSTSNGSQTAGKAVAKPYFTTTSSNEPLNRYSENDFSRIAELQAKARMKERNYPSGYQGL
jgi:hypothetical protein